MHCSPEGFAGVPWGAWIQAGEGRARGACMLSTAPGKPAWLPRGGIIFIDTRERPPRSPGELKGLGWECGGRVLGSPVNPSPPTDIISNLSIQRPPHCCLFFATETRRGHTINVTTDFQLGRSRAHVKVMNSLKPTREHLWLPVLV